MRTRDGREAACHSVMAAAGLVGLLLAIPDLGLAAEASFTTKPSAAREADRVRITFAVSAPTDVEVAILDGKGAIVRHLAAGLLGPKAPGPLAKDSLAQSITWDGKDDLGQPAAGAPFKVRVSLGARPRLEKIVGWDGNSFGSTVVGLAVGKGGEVFVLTSEGSRGRATMRVLGRDGRYRRTVLPYPATLPAERLAPLGQLEIDRQRVPIVYSGHSGCVVPLTSGMKKQNMVFSPKGHLVLASAVGTIVEHGPPRHLLALAPDGGAAEGVPFVGPQIRKPIGMMGGAGEGFTRFFDHLAVSPDGEWIYLTPFKLADRRPRHAVFRLKWTDAEIGAPFLGKDGEPGSDDAHFNDPQGLATDRDGNLYVCDRGNNRVMVFSAGGKALGSFAVEDPEQVAVHPASGEVYVACRKAGARVVDSRLLKFSAWGREAPRQLARLDLRNLDLIALDGEAKRPILWVYAGRDLLAVVDTGARFEAGSAVNSDAGLAYPTFIAADPDRGRVILDDSFASRGTLTVVDLKTGRKSPFVKGTAMALDRAGNVYVMDGYSTNSLSRYDPSGAPLPFPGTGTNKIETGIYRGYGPDLGMRGICLGVNNDLYILRSNNYGLEDGSAAQVDVFGPDGRVKKRGLIAGLGHGDCGLGVDAAGNVYVGCNLKPKDRPLPEAFTGKVPAQGWRDWRRPREVPWWYTYYNAYLFHLAAVVKFSPEGGVLYGHRPNGLPKDRVAPLADPAAAPADAESLVSGYLGREIKVKGALWRYHGMGVVATSELNWGDPCCMCMVSQLAVDDYGRVFVPNPFRFAVEVLDTNGNLITRVGRYGNADDAGPEIAFAWPTFVSVAGGKLVVGDATSQRLTVVGIDHLAEATCEVR